MGVIIDESGLKLGEYRKENVFHIEVCPQYTKRIRQMGIKTCELVLLKKGKIQDREMGKAKMGIVINHSENIFLRQTRSNSYAFGIDDQGLVRHTEFLP